MKDVRGENVLITGAASGMGREWAKRFAAAGARLVLWDIQAEALDGLVDDLREQGTDVRGQVVDVSQRLRVYEAAKVLEEQRSGIDILVNNAGIVHSGPFLDTPDEQLRATMEVDLMSLFWTTKAFLANRRLVLAPRMMKLTPVLKALLPPPVFEQVSRLFGATHSMDRWKDLRR